MNNFIAKKSINEKVMFTKEVDNLDEENIKENFNYFEEQINLLIPFLDLKNEIRVYDYMPALESTCFYSIKINKYIKIYLLENMDCVISMRKADRTYVYKNWSQK